MEPTAQAILQNMRPHDLCYDLNNMEQQEMTWTNTERELFSCSSCLFPVAINMFTSCLHCKEKELALVQSSCGRKSRSHTCWGLLLAECPGGEGHHETGERWGVCFMSFHLFSRFININTNSVINSTLTTLILVIPQAPPLSSIIGLKFLPS